jgi:signal transduction histidine kinase
MSGVMSRPGWRAWSTFRIAVILMVAAVIGMAGVLTVVSRAIDAHQMAREEELAERRLHRALESIGEDLTGASVWDEAVEHLSAPTDVAWFDRYMAGFYSMQTRHAVTLAFDETGSLTRVSRAGRAVATDASDPFVQAARPLVDRLRAEAADRDRRGVAIDAVRLRPGIVQVGDAIYLLGTSTVVRHTDEGPAPAADPVVASFKPFQTVVDAMGERLGMRDVAFQSGDSPVKDRASIDVRNPQGALLGRIVWTPERPGTRILFQAGPLLLLLMMVLKVGGGVLLWRMARDVRRLRASEAALSGALERAEAANAAKSRFLSNISHELRTPLNGVLGMAEVIGQDLVTPQQRDRLEILKASGQQQLRMIEELLDVVRLRDGAVTLEERPFRPEAVLRRLVADHRGAAKARGLKLKVEAAKGEWIGDEVHVEKLAAALVDNAIRFTTKGGVTLRAIEADGLTLEVEDTGPGMAPDAVARLFEAFTQGDESSTRAADGLGLGLSAAHGLARLMGGRVEVRSTPGEGSLFRVILPLRPVRPSAGGAV